MSKIRKLKRQLIEQANKRILGEDVHTHKSPIQGKPSPRFGGIVPIFVSDVDKALYIVYNALQKSKREPEFLQWLSELGYTQDEMTTEGKKIKEYIKTKIMDQGERGNIPNPFGPDGANIKVVVPVTAEEPRMGSEPLKVNDGYVTENSDSEEEWVPDESEQKNIDSFNEPKRWQNLKILTDKFGNSVKTRTIDDGSQLYEYPDGSWGFNDPRVNDEEPKQNNNKNPFSTFPKDWGIKGGDMWNF